MKELREVSPSNIKRPYFTSMFSGSLQTKGTIGESEKGESRYEMGSTMTNAANHVNSGYLVKKVSLIAKSS